MPLVRPIAFVCALLVAQGCAPMVDQALMFKETQRRYTNLMRFADFERAIRFVAPDERTAFRERTSSLGEIRFSDYEVRELENLGETATAQVQYSAFRDSNPVLITFVEEQHWEQLDGVWVVRPSFTEHVP
jgi:hypothetical protein